MSLRIRTSAYRALLLTLGVLLLSGSAHAARTISTLTLGTQTPNPAVQTQSATWSITTAYTGSLSTCTATLSISWTPPAGATANFSTTTVSNSSPNATLTIQTTSGTPASTTPFTVKATNTSGCTNTTTSASDSDNLVVVAGTAPAFTSAAATTFTVGTAGSFNVTATGSPAPTFTKTGTLPSGVTLSTAGVLSGTPAAGTGGTYPITITASNGIGTAATQTFTLTVNQAPAITSANNTTFTVNTAGTFTPTATGFPTPTITESGTLPSGVTFTAGVLSGTPSVGGSFPITFTASNGVGTNATQNFTLTVSKLTGTVSIVSALPNPSVTGQPVAVSVSVTAVGSNPGPTGNVAITTTGSSATCTATLTQGSPSTGSCNLTPPAAGSLTFTAAYAGDSFYNSGTGTTAHTANKASTTTTITNDLSASTTVGQAYAVAVTVAAVAPGAGTPTGTATVTDATATCTATLTAGSGSCSLTSTTVGTKTITATYVTDANFLASTSAGVSHSVTIGNATVTLTSSPATTVYGQSVTFTATVSPVPTAGDVITFKDGATAIGTGTTNGSGVATLAITTLDVPTSPHAITASFPGDANLNPNTSNTLNYSVTKASTSTTISTGTLSTATVVGQAYPVSGTVAITSPGGGTIPGTDTVTAGDGSATCSAPVSAGTWTCNLTSTTAGTKTITASFTGDANYNTSSAGTTRSHTVNKAATTTTITSDLSTPTTVGQAYTVAFTVTVNSPGSGTVPGTDTVNVTDGTASCSGTIATGSCSLTSTSGGVKTITATFVTDTNFAASTSAGVSHTVNAAPTFTSAATTTFKIGAAGSFQVTATGTPAPTYSEVGSLPSGVNFSTSGLLSGTPGAGTIGSYPIVITATNGVTPDATQNFTLVVGQAPTITSPNTASFTAGTSGTFQVVATGTPTPTVSVTAGTLPDGLTMDSTGLISGNPQGGQTQVVTVTATNGLTPNATQSLTIQVGEAPFIDPNTSSISAAVGSPISFQFFIDIGTPSTGTWTETGTLPAGVTLSTSGLLSGTPTGIGNFPILVQFDNGVPPAATENFSISVGKAATYIQPFNTGHGWTYTFTCSKSALGSCSNNAADTATADCQAQPCVQATEGDILSGSMTGYFSHSYTWVQLGVPSQATVVAVSGGFWDKSSTGCQSTATAGIQIYDSANATQVTSGAVFPNVSVDPDTAGVTHANSAAQAVSSLYQASGTTVTLRFNLNPVASTSTCNINGDNFTLTISYVPFNQHQVIFAKAHINRFGEIGHVETIAESDKHQQAGF